jgi:hypothetical protein
LAHEAFAHEGFMGRKNQIQPFLSMPSGDLTQASIVGLESTVFQTDVVNCIFSWAGGNTTNGDIAIEVWSSADIGWVPLEFGATISLNGASGAHTLIIEQVSFLKIRPKYTRTNASATGTLKVLIVATTVGG